MLQFSDQDNKAMLQRGSDPQWVAKQFAFFKEGFPYAQLDRIATIDDGIERLTEEEKKEYIAYFEQQAPHLKIEKFVPASGAASRMFKDLFDFLETGKMTDKIKVFLDQLEHFAFYEDLKRCFPEGTDLKKIEPKLIVEKLVTDSGLNYGALPKGVLQFHIYPDHQRTAIEEHLVEAAQYAASGKDAYIHFTVSPNHLERFKELIEEKKGIYEKRFKITYHISYSIQDPKTDTLAANLDLTPFRDAEGKLLYRPGGHGALIHNLNNLDADLVFVKNIDNVTTEERLQPTIDYKKVCAGMALQLRNKTNEYLKKLAQTPNDPELIKEVVDFGSKRLHIAWSRNIPPLIEIQNKIDKPIRVCGMVKNEGEPGGGPFWVKRGEEVSCQIVETSQIDKNNPQQQEILQQATHFNPVDMICCWKNHEGKPYDLLQYVDEKAGFISDKSYEGATLKAMELPGLWNGAMANWNTLFVEVPLATFNPVKTVFDLLRN